MSRRLGDKKTLIWSLYIYGDIQKAHQNLKSAKDALEECIALCREIGYEAVEDISLILLGRIHYQMGDHAAARTSLQKGLILADRLSDRWGVASSLEALGEILMDEGSYEEAQDHFERCIEPSRLIGDKTITGSALLNLAVVTHLEGRFELSDKYAEEALEIFQAVGYEQQQQDALRLMGYAAIQANNIVRARVLIGESLKISTRLESTKGQLAAIAALASLASAEKDYQRAVTLCTWVVNMNDTNGIKPSKPDANVLNDVLAQAKHELSPNIYQSAVERGRSLNLNDILVELMA